MNNEAESSPADLVSCILVLHLDLDLYKGC